MGLEVNLAALDGRRERVKLTSQLSRGVGSGTQERRPRRSTTRTGRVGAFSTAEGRFHVRERFSIFRLWAETLVFEGPRKGQTIGVKVQSLKPNRSASSVATYISTGHGNRRMPRFPATVRPARYAIT